MHELWSCVVAEAGVEDECSWEMESCAEPPQGTYVNSGVHEWPFFSDKHTVPSPKSHHCNKDFHHSDIRVVHVSVVSLKELWDNSLTRQHCIYLKSWKSKREEKKNKEWLLIYKLLHSFTKELTVLLLSWFYHIFTFCNIQCCGKYMYVHNAAFHDTFLQPCLCHILI